MTLEAASVESRFRRLRVQAAVVRALLDDLEATLVGHDSAHAASQLAEELARLGCRIGDVATQFEPPPSGIHLR